MYDPITELVARYWIEERGLPEAMSPEQQQIFLTVESERIAELIEQRVILNRDLALATYQQQNGEPPTYLTMVSLSGQARRSAVETVIAEEVLGEEDPTTPFPPTGQTREQTREREHARIQVHRSDPERWTNPLNCRDSETSIAQLANQLWSGRSPQYRLLAQTLLQARVDDGQAIPASPADPLLASFTDQLDRAATRVGRFQLGAGEL